LLQQPILPAAVRLPSDFELERLGRTHGRLWTPHSADPGRRCPTCLGTRQYQWYADRRASIETWECRCEDQFVLHRYLLSRGLGSADMTLGWDDMVNVPEEALEFLGGYAQHVEAYVTRGIGMVLHGPHGTGKSSLSHLFMRRLMIDGYDAYFIRFKPLIDMWRTIAYSKTANEDDREWFTKRILNVQILVIDDLGKEYVGNATKIEQRKAEEAGIEVDYENDARSRLEDLLRLRNSASRPTFITTNEDLAAIGTKYGSSVMEMIKERSKVCRVPGSNFRDRFYAGSMDEVAKGLSRPIVMQ